MSIRSRWLRSRMIIPAHVPNTGPANERTASSSPYSRISRMNVVDSPPGTTSPSNPSSCSGLRTSTTLAPSRRSIAACSRKFPWTAKTPTFMTRILPLDATLPPVLPGPKKGQTPQGSDPCSLSSPAACLEQLFGRNRRGGETEHRVAETFRHAREDLRIVVVRRRFDDRLRASRRVCGLEDPRADEDAVRAELHAERRVGGSCDSAGGERHDREPSVLRDPLHELVRRAQLLRLGVELVLAQRTELADVSEHRAHVRHGVDDVTRARLALRADHRRAFGDSPQRFPEVRAAADERHGELPLVDV